MQNVSEHLYLLYAWLLYQISYRVTNETRE